MHTRFDPMAEGSFAWGLDFPAERIVNYVCHPFRYRKFLIMSNDPYDSVDDQ